MARQPAPRSLALTSRSPRLLAFALLTLFGCGPRRWSSEATDAPVAPPVAAAPTGEPGAGPDATRDPEGAVTLTPAEAPPPLARVPRVAFAAPKDGASIAADKTDAFEVRVDVRDWFVEPGEHIHLVLDNRPYKALEAGKTAIRLGDIFPNEPLAEGQHVLVAFAARPDHMAVKPQDPLAAGVAKPKEGGPFAMVGFWVGKPGKAAFKPGDAALVYSRPKGTYNGGDAERVLLDFWVANAPLGEGRWSVLAVVTPPRGEAATARLDSWTPMVIGNLPDGTTKVTLELRDKDDRPVAGPFGRIEREISVNRAASGPTL
ncbi:MAG: hypothetical protein WKG00_07685 [Polyangiaceae bacterium]